MPEYLVVRNSNDFFLKKGKRSHEAFFCFPLAIMGKKNKADA
jgi:hypothetical protein